MHVLVILLYVLLRDPRRRGVIIVWPSIAQLDLE